MRRTENLHQNRKDPKLLTLEECSFLTQIRASFTRATLDHFCPGGFINILGGVDGGVGHS